MNTRLIFATALLGGASLVISCSQPITAEQRIATLEAERQQIIADLIRHNAECQAQAVEFSGVPGKDKIIAGCLDGHRQMVEASKVSIASIDGALAKLGAKPGANPFDQFDGK